MAKQKSKVSNKKDKTNVLRKQEKAREEREVKKKMKTKRKQYSGDMLDKALEFVKKGNTFMKASEKFGVPVTTLYRKLKNPLTKNVRSGPPTILSSQEEQQIANWIKYRAERGWPVTKPQLLDAVQKYVKSLNIKSPFINDRPGRHWYEGFLKRNQDISIRTSQNLCLDRASVTQEDLRGWFSEIQAYLSSKNLLHIDASRIYNCDESSIQLCPKSNKVLTEKGSRTVYKIIDGNEKECLTVLFMYSADGIRAPPMILYKYQEKIPRKIAENCPTGWGLGVSESGWMTSETFFEYMTNIFYPWLIQNNVVFPVIIYFDGHSSHMTVPLVSFCRERNIELIALYPHSTHIIQPLDIAFFHPFKEAWKVNLTQWFDKNNIKKLSKEHFAPVLEITLNSMKEEKHIIKNGFKSAGLWPFNPDIVNYNVLKKKKKKVSEDTSLNNTVTSDPIEKQDFLKDFESDIQEDLLNQFKNCEATGIWSGDVEQKGLFVYWLKRKQQSTGKYFLHNVK